MWRIKQVISPRLNDQAVCAMKPDLFILRVTGMNSQPKASFKHSLLESIYLLYFLKSLRYMPYNWGTYPIIVEKKLKFW